MEKLEKAIWEANDFNDPLEKEQREAEVSAARRLMKAVRVRLEPLVALVKPILVQFQWIFAGEAMLGKRLVGRVTTQLVNHTERTKCARNATCTVELVGRDRWFCRLGLDSEVPYHSTFSKNRHGRFRDCDLLRKLFETVVRRCMAEGLVDGMAFAVDASLIAADANKQRSTAGTDGDDWEALARTRRSVREYLDTLNEAARGAASETVPKVQPGPSQ